MSFTQIKPEKSLLQKYSISVPRYTSYPTAPMWTEDFTVEDFKAANEKGNSSNAPISLYFHLPFCESQCYFCACNIIISKKQEIVRPYLEYIKKEIRKTAKLISKDRKVEQIHFGGGTPTFFHPEELGELFSLITDSFTLSEDCEIGIEIDPRVTTFDHMETLSNLGFNRVSMGIQDFNDKVQESINRVQPYYETNELISYARDMGFVSVNVDLIYGLPFQTKETFEETTNLIINLNPDRIALFHYAHLPSMVPHQKKYIQDDSLPSSDEKIKIFQFAVDKLSESGYSFIGLDHFARYEDELARARREKTLHRNFQGYTTKAGCDLYGFGITSISNVQDTFSQNIKKLNPYYEAIDSESPVIFRGFNLNSDDVLRKDIIMKILCHGMISKKEIEEEYKISFDEYFSFEINKLKDFESEKLVELSDSEIKITGLGQYFLRNIASTFDYYLQRKDGKEKIYSKSV